MRGRGGVTILLIYCNKYKSFFLYTHSYSQYSNKEAIIELVCTLWRLYFLNMLGHFLCYDRIESFSWVIRIPKHIQSSIYAIEWQEWRTEQLNPIHDPHTASLVCVLETYKHKYQQLSKFFCDHLLSKQAKWNITTYTWTM